MSPGPPPPFSGFFSLEKIIERSALNCSSNSFRPRRLFEIQSKVSTSTFAISFPNSSACSAVSIFPSPTNCEERSLITFIPIPEKLSCSLTSTSFRRIAVVRSGTVTPSAVRKRERSCIRMDRALSGPTAETIPWIMPRSILRRCSFEASAWRA